jgi:hypothetical protein
VFCHLHLSTLRNMGDEGILKKSVSDLFQYTSTYPNSNWKISARCGCHLFAMCMKETDKVACLSLLLMRPASPCMCKKHRVLFHALLHWIFLRILFIFFYVLYALLPNTFYLASSILFLWFYVIYLPWFSFCRVIIRQLFNLNSL